MSEVAPARGRRRVGARSRRRRRGVRRGGGSGACRGRRARMRGCGWAPPSALTVRFIVGDLGAHVHLGAAPRHAARGAGEAARRQARCGEAEVAELDRRVVSRDEYVRRLEIAVQDAGAVHVVKGVAQRLEVAQDSPLAERALAAGALEPRDEVASRAELHHNRDRAAAVVVPVEEDVLKAHDVGVLQPLQHRCLLQRLVGHVDRVAAHLLEHEPLRRAHHQPRLAKVARAQHLLRAVRAAASRARTLLRLVAPLPEGASDHEPAEQEGAARDVQCHNDLLGQLDGDGAPLRVVRDAHVLSHRH